MRQIHIFHRVRGAAGRKIVTNELYVYVYSPWTDNNERKTWGGGRSGIEGVNDE